MPSLPSELWMEVFEHVDRADLPNVSRVSKLFHVLVTHILHSVFDTAKYSYDGRSRKIRIASDLFLIRAEELEASGTLGYFKKAAFKACGPLDGGVNVVSQSDWLYHQLHTVEHLHDFHTRWILDPNNQNINGYVALILRLLSTSLESLTLTHFDSILGMNQPYIHGVMMECGFERLREVRLVTYPWDGTDPRAPRTGYFDVADLRPFLELKSLQKLSIEGLRSFSTGDSGARCLAKQLELPRFLASRDDLKRLIDCFPELKRLQLSTPLASAAWIFGLDIVDYIPKLGTSLAKLVLNRGVGNVLPLPDLTKLANFRVLKHLRVDIHTVLGRPNHPSIRPLYDPKDMQSFIKLLPKSLEELVIAGGEAGMLDYVPLILCNKVTNLPQLKKLTMIFYRTEWGMGGWPKNSIGGGGQYSMKRKPRAVYVEMAQSVGVDLILVNENLQNDSMRRKGWI